MNTRNYKTAAPQSNIIDPWRLVIEKQMCIKKEKEVQHNRICWFHFPTSFFHLRAERHSHLKLQFVRKLFVFFSLIPDSSGTDALGL